MDGMLPIGNPVRMLVTLQNHGCDYKYTVSWQYWKRALILEMTVSDGVMILESGGK